MKCEVIFALDVETRERGYEILSRMEGSLRWVKVGLQLFTRYGPGIVRELGGKGYSVFLDLKLHDIPNTVASSIQSIGSLPVEMLTIHTSGGREMMIRAEEARRIHAPHLRLLGVTVLTSMDAEALRETGVESTPEKQVRKLAELARHAGLSGLVCSPLETSLLRRELGPDLTLVTPGIRPKGTSSDEQKRILTPEQARDAGSDFIVIGRPLLQAEDPGALLRKIQRDIQPPTGS
ncbi:MAG: orotidine-5'-phosphate decarboxylase [Opitutales bacterium]